MSKNNKLFSLLLLICLLSSGLFIFSSPVFAYSSSSYESNDGGFICGIIYILISVVIGWVLVSKTGHSGCLSLLIIVPIVNLIFILYLALSDWPIEKELKELKERLKLQEEVNEKHDNKPEEKKKITHKPSTQ